MGVQTVNILTGSGIIEYSDYLPQRVNIEATGNAKKIRFAAYSGNNPVSVVGIQLDDGDGNTITIPVSFILTLGDIVEFPQGTLTASTAAPVILSGIHYEALVRMRQAMVELVNESPVYAQQDFPEKAPFTALYCMDSTRFSNPFRKEWEDDKEVYYYECSARILIINASEGAQSFIERFMYRVDSRQGIFWQYLTGCAIDRSGNFENVTPILDRLKFQEMAQVMVTLRFVHKHYESDNWIDSTAITTPGVVTLTLKMGDD